MSTVLEVREPNPRLIAKPPRSLIRGFDLLSTTPNGVEKLRGLIRSMAVRGLLVPQEQGDESAAELLKRVRPMSSARAAEALQAEDAGTSAPYKLPPKWAWSPLGALVENMGSGWSPACDEGERADADRWAVLRTTAVQILEYRPQEHKAIPLKLAGRPGIEVRKDDILITRAGPMNRVGISCWVSETPAKLMLSDKIVRMHPISAELLPAFVVLALNAGWAKDQLEDAKTGMAASQVNISQSDLQRIVLPICSTSEQRRIVARVEELMKLCDALEQSGRLADEQHARLTSTLFDALGASESAHALAENWQRVAEHFNLLLDRSAAIDALEQTILQLAVRGLLAPQNAKDEHAASLRQRIHSERTRLFASGAAKREKPLKPVQEDEHAFPLPSNWVWVRFDELVKADKPIAYGVLVPGPDAPGGVPFVRLGDLSLENPAPQPEKSISTTVDAEFARTRLDGGEILLGVVGSIGKLGVAPATWKGANIARAICRIVPTPLVDRTYVLNLLQSQFMRERFSGDTRTLAQPTLNVGLIRACPTPLPPVDEQHRIVARVEELRRLCADLRLRLTQAREVQSRLADALVAEVA